MRRYWVEVVCDRCEACEFFEKPEGASERDRARAAGWLYLANGEQICEACQVAPVRVLSFDIPPEARYRPPQSRYLLIAPPAREGGAEGEETPWSAFTTSKRWQRAVSCGRVVFASWIGTSSCPLPGMLISRASKR
jgi:hypothetical protein